VFLGTYAPRLDEKGRIIMPAKFAEDLENGVVLTRGQERCIYVFPQAEFERMHETLRQAPVTSREARNFLRVFLSGAHAETPDKQRRVTIPPALRAYAGLERDLTVAGVGTRLEIWDTNAWQEYMASQEDAFADIAGEVIPGLF
jgi:MraZ protein